MAFLNGELDEKIYIDQLIGLSLEDKSTKFTSSNVLYMALNNHLGNGTLSFKSHDFIWIYDACGGPLRICQII